MPRDMQGRIYTLVGGGQASPIEDRLETMMITKDKFFPLRNDTGRLSLDGSAVRRARLTAELTQAEVTQRMRLLGYDLSQPYVSAVERSCYRWGFSERMAAALAAALGVGVSQLTGGRLVSKADARKVRELADQLNSLAGPAE